MSQKRGESPSGRLIGKAVRRQKWGSIKGQVLQTKSVAWKRGGTVEKKRTAFNLISQNKPLG